MDSLKPHLLVEKLDVMFDSLENAAKFIVAFGFFLKDVGVGCCCYIYAHKNSTLMYQSKLLVEEEKLSKIKVLLKNVNGIESCAQEWTKAKSKTYNLMIVTFFAVLLNGVSMRLETAVLPEQLVTSLSEMFDFWQVNQETMQW